MTNFQDQEQANFALFRRIMHTPPDRVKKVDYKGYECRSVDPMYIVERATQVFGPRGKGWGFKVIDHGIEDGGPAIYNREIQNYNKKIAYVLIDLWYVDPETGERCECGSQFGHCTFLDATKKGPFTDDEFFKKAVTDAMKKSFAWIGLGADIHIGLYDDDKYVQWLRDGGPEQGQQEQQQVNGTNNGRHSNGLQPMPNRMDLNGHANGQQNATPQFLAFRKRCEQLAKENPRLFKSANDALHQAMVSFQSQGLKEPADVKRNNTSSIFQQANFYLMGLVNDHREHSQEQPETPTQVNQEMQGAETHAF